MSVVASALATASVGPRRAAFELDVASFAARTRAVEPPATEETDGDEAPGGDPESLLLACCAAEIAREAGPDAVVHAIGARRQAALLSAALDAVPGLCSERSGGGRPLVYVSRIVAEALDADAMLALLRRFARLHGDDALLVVAVGSGGAAPPTGDSARRHHRCGTAWLDRLAGLAGWQLCQLWSDGMARHALHVLERTGRTGLLRAS